MNNLEYFKIFHTDIFQKIDTLTLAINNNLYKEKYQLEYIEDKKSFDIMDISTNTYIYQKQINHFDNNLLRQLNFDSKNTILCLNQQQYTQSLFDLSEISQAYLENNKIIADVSSDLSNIKNAIKINFLNSAKKHSHFDKFIFAGVLLGSHIKNIINKFECSCYFIIEANLEIFRLSMFVTDYKSLHKDNRKIIYSIMDDNISFSTKYKIFSNSPTTCNQIYKYASTNYAVDDIFSKLIANNQMQDPFIMQYRSSIEYLIKRPFKNFYNYRILKIDRNLSHKVFEQMPVLFLGAGPSIGDNIQWISKNQKKFIIVAMASILKKLIAFNIVPNIITTLDHQEHIILNQFGSNAELYQDSIILASNKTSPKVLNKISSKKLFLYETGKSFSDSCIATTGLSVGEATIQLLLSLNASQIYLLGTDLAINQETGLSHDSDSVSGKTKFDITSFSSKSQIEQLSNTNIRTGLLKVKGNLRESVFTTRLFDASRLHYQEIITKYKKPAQKIFNLSSSGALIDGAQPIFAHDISFNNLEILDKHQINQKMQINLENICYTKMPDETNTKIQNDKKIINELITFLEHFKNKPSKTHKEFDQIANKILVLILNMPTESLLLTIYLNFYQIINSYINYFFNDVSIKNNYKIAEIQFIWCELLKNILNSYGENLPQDT